MASTAVVAIAKAPGSVTVTVTARPRTTTWQMGQGDPVVCAGPGVQWRAGLDPAGSECTFTYVNSSSTQAGNRFAASVQVDWQFSWTLNNVPQGAFGSIDVSEDFAVPVGEIQALNNG